MKPEGCMKEDTPIVEGDKSSDETGFGSLDLAYGEAKSLIQVQFAQIDGLDTKASTLLAAAGLVLSVLISGQALSLFFLDGKTIRPTYNYADYVLLASASLFILISLVLGVMSLYVRHYKWAPHPKTMRTKYLDWAEDKTKLRILDNLIGAYEENAKTISEKARLLQYGFTLFAIGTALLVVIFVVIIAQYYNAV
jgi:hypothetical protein